MPSFRLYFCSIVCFVSRSGFEWASVHRAQVYTLVHDVQMNMYGWWSGYKPCAFVIDTRSKPSLIHILICSWHSYHLLIQRNNFSWASWFVECLTSTTSTTVMQSKISLESFINSKTLITNSVALCSSCCTTLYCAVQCKAHWSLRFHISNTINDYC